MSIMYICVQGNWSRVRPLKRFFQAFYGTDQPKPLRTHYSHINKLSKIGSIRASDVYQVFPVHQYSLDTIFRNLAERTDNSNIYPAVEYSNYLCRLSSFRNFSGKFTPSALKLAKAGYYSTGNNNETACFHCGYRYSAWKLNDDPFSIHKSINPGCEFIKEMEEQYNTDERYVSGPEQDQACSSNEESVMREPPVDVTVSPPSYINTATVHEVLPGPTAIWPDFAVGCTRLQSLVDASEYGDVCKDILTDLARKGFFSSGFERLRCFQCGKKFQIKVSRLKASNGILDVCVQHARVSKECPFLLKTMSSDFIDYVNSPTVICSNVMDNANTEERSELTPECPFQIHEPSVEDIRAENEVYKQKTMCIVCTVNPKCVLFLPCGHCTHCNSCAWGPEGASPGGCCPVPDCGTLVSALHPVKLG